VGGGGGKNYIIITHDPFGRHLNTSVALIIIIIIIIIIIGKAEYVRR